MVNHYTIYSLGKTIKDTANILNVGIPQENIERIV